MHDAFVIVGASLAGANAAQALREEGFTGPIVLIGEEDELPYERPPLSKDYLMGKAGKEKLYALPAEWYEENNVQLKLGETVTGIDRGAQKPGAGVRRYRALRQAAAHHAARRPARLRVPGADADGVHYLRRIQDSDAIRSAFAASARSP